MAFAAGTQFGIYRVTGLIGVGGMGEVYRATDTTLRREVAIKILPGSFSADTERVARFEREARTLASLNHANIGQIFGLERRDGTTALVMELVEGLTLADRLMQGAIPVEEALDVARQIADGLSAAHALGIVHRDLKPANIKLRADGTVKVLDFGIAKALDPRAISGPQAPPLTTPAMTEAGIVMGTAAYMSPEQARGKPVDQRADIWAFACVLYEMLTGRPPFSGDDVTATLARVLERDADMSALPTGLSPAVWRTLELCLRKDARRRVADIRDVALALDGQFDTTDAVQIGDRQAHSGARRGAVIAAAALGGAALVGLASWSTWPEPELRPVRRFVHVLPEGQSFTGTELRVIDLSPDGNRLVYNGVGGLRIFDMATLEDRAIASTDKAVFEPTFSPDGQWIAFASDSMIYRMAATGGPAVPLTDASGLVAMRWAWNDSILLLKTGGIWRVPGTGGTAELVVAAIDDGGWPPPTLLPDGDTVLHRRFPSSGESNEVIAQSIATGERTVVANLARDASDVRYVPTGHLVYVLGDTLFGIAFDARTKRTSGAAVPLIQGISRTASTGAQGRYAIGSDGTLAYARGIGDARAPRTLVWVDREGTADSLGMEPRGYAYVQISPDGTRLALEIQDRENDIFVYDLGRRSLQPLTRDPARNRGGIWTPDSRRIAFTQQLSDSEEIYWQAADGSGTAEPLTQGSGMPLHPIEIAHDGTLFYVGALTPRDIFTISTAGPADVGTPLLDGPASESSPALSLDGRWLAYVYNESDSAGPGDFDIYVRPFPDVGARRWHVASGVHPQWSPDGDELFYLEVQDNGEVAMMSVKVDSGESFRAGERTKLFQGRYFYGALVAAPHVYDVDKDRGFLMIKEAGAAGAAVRPDIVIVQNWFEELKRLVPSTTPSQR